MVSIPILIASPQGESGETFQVTTELIDELNRVGFRTNVFLTPSLNFAACGGCLACEKDDDCIVNDDIQNFQEKLLISPGFVMATPVYLMGPPGRLKCLLDRFWPWTLRPQLFGKYAAVLVTAASFGALNVAEYLTAIIESWGCRVVNSTTVTLKTPNAASKRKKIILDCRLLSRRLTEAIEKKKRIGLSSLGKQFISNIWGLIRDNPDEYKLSFDYWQENDIARSFGLS